MESQPFAGFEDVREFASSLDAFVVQPLLHLPQDQDIYLRLSSFISTILQNLVEAPYNLKTTEELPAILATELGHVMRAMVRSFGRIKSAERAFCVLADRPLGASLCQDHHVLELLIETISGQNEDAAKAALFAVCSMLHSPLTRDWFVDRLTKSAVLPKLLAVLEDYTSNPVWTSYNHAALLALNWIGGSHVGSRFLIPHVPKLVRALAAEGETARVTLLLTAANLPAYMSEDELALESLRRQGLIEPLLPHARLKKVSAGSVGAIMGLLNLRAHLGEEAAFEMDEDMTVLLVDCLSHALRSESQGNIL